jgi:hypothetical protein
MTSLGKPLMGHILAQLDAFNWLMDVNPGNPHPPSAVDIAHARRVDLAKLDARTERDIGMSAADATGISNHQEALPFFMQAGFK